MLGGVRRSSPHERLSPVPHGQPKLVPHPQQRPRALSPVLRIFFKILVIWAKFSQNHQILFKKFLISQILWVLGISTLVWFSAIPSTCSAAIPVLRIFFLKILVMRANFGDFGILVSTSKFWKKFVTRVTPYWDKFFKILTFEFWWNRKVMINHRGGILIFCQILSKMKILDFRVKDFKFWILGLRISNFEISPILSISAKFSSNL